MASGSRRSGTDRRSRLPAGAVRCLLVPGPEVLLSPVRGARTYSPSIRWYIRCRAGRRRKGVEGGRTGKPGGRSVSFSSVIGRRGRWTGGVPRTFKMQISERARRSGTRNADVNVRASAGQVFYWGQLPFPSPQRSASCHGGRDPAAKIKSAAGTSAVR